MRLVLELLAVAVLAIPFGWLWRRRQRRYVKKFQEQHPPRVISESITVTRRKKDEEK